MSEYIDVTPTWERVLPLYLAAIKHADGAGARAAEQELLRMAQAADKWNAHVKPKSSNREIVERVRKSRK